MPAFCCILKCGNRGKRDKVNFFRIPVVRNFKHKSKLKLNALSYKRREKWMKVIKRTDFSVSFLKNARVCSNHFISGKPAKLEEIYNLDWVPNINLGYDQPDSPDTNKSKELIDYDEKTMQDVLRLHSSGDMSIGWSHHDKDIPAVIIHDKLMTDAAFGHATLLKPIKSEHSYSLSSDGGSLPDSPRSLRKDDMEDECFPAISMKKACGKLEDMEEDIQEDIEIKDEPISETDSIHSSCPSSPQTILSNTTDYHFSIDLKDTQNILRQTGLVLSSPHNILPQKLSQIPKLSIRIEPSAASNFHLPPTPPSCSSSSDDSEDNITISPSPSSKKNSITSTAKLLLNHHTTTRQPIHTHLISSQPKGSTGTLVLTEEEKRTLIAEGYPVPTRLPLSKAEEKSLKKIRRKIKNKISAQESRRKKKEYMDQLERKVGLLVNENNEYRKKIENLQDSNNNLLVQLQKLQALVSKTHPHLIKQFDCA